jgi:thioredoxin 1
MTKIVSVQNQNINQQGQRDLSAGRSKMADAAQVAQKAAGTVFGFFTHPITVILTVGSLVDAFVPGPDFSRFLVSLASGIVMARGIGAMKKTFAPDKPAWIRSGSPASQASSVIEITKDNFKKEVLESKAPVILDAYATWCPPCKAVAPIFDTLSREMSGKVKFVKFNVDSDASLARELDITSMPTFLMFKEGKMVGRETGVPSLDKNAFAFNLIGHIL